MNFESALKFLTTGAIRLTPRQCLNDPFEILTTNRLKIKYRNSIDIDKFQNYLDYFGVVSFTETKDNLLMWSHYAEEHKGIVVEFNIEDTDPLLIFNNDPIQNKDSFHSKVFYRKNRHYDSIDNEFDARDVAKHYYFSKSDEWIYEKEYRFLIPFNSATHVIFNPEKTPKSILSKLPEPFDGSNVLDIIYIDDMGTLSELWLNSQKHHVIFTKLIKPKNISAIYAGCRCDLHALKNRIKQNVENDRSYPSLNFYNDFLDKFDNVYKGIIHTNRYEINFVKDRVKS